MNIEFHYYLLYILCLKAGFTDFESYTIAYSSQYVDDNIISNTVKLSGKDFETIATQNYGWWGDVLPKAIYIPFHFFPGEIDYEKSERLDKRKNPFNCTPDSKNVRLLLEEAFKTKNLYRIGIALHTYADSFAHQNFSGLNEDWNVVKVDTILPNVGHAELMDTPDKMELKWVDYRLVEVNKNIENLERFLECGKNIYILLCNYQNKSPVDKDKVMSYIETLFYDANKNDAPLKSRLLDYVLAENLLEYNKYDWIKSAVNYDPAKIFLGEELEEYNKLEWIRDAILYQTAIIKKPVLHPFEGFYESEWYNWNKAAKEHLECAKKILKGMI